jgi:hypothetical protein
MSDPNLIVAQKRAEAQKSALQFPYDYTIENNYTIISFYEYTRINPLSIPKEELKRHIILPLPYQGLQDKNTLNYSQEETGQFVGGTLGTLGGTGGNALNALGGAAAAIGANVLRSITGATGDAINSATQRATANKFTPGGYNPGVKINKNLANMAPGTVQNPNLGLAFGGVELRTHTFSWSLTAKSAEESKMIADIINELRLMAMPRKTFGSSYALSYPFIVDIVFQPNLIKVSKLKCFLTEISVNYSGGDHLAFYRDTGAPVTVDLTLSFKERAILTADDYKE